MVNKSLTNKKIIISAGASGIGLSTAKVCLARGATVYLCDIDSKSLNKLNSYLHKDAPLYIDFFSLNNANEWGPLARKTFDENNLYKHGYELGDVFYKKRGFNELAFLHYFQLDEILKLLELTEFRLEWVKNIGYAKNPGKIVNSENEGNFLIKALKV